MRSLLGAWLRWIQALTVLGILSIGAASAGRRAIRFEKLSVAEGLSQSTVMCMLQDSRGFLWLGTEAGLNRYDGRVVTVYRHDVHDPSSLPSDFVWALAEDASGDLWIATEGGGLARWERSRDRFVRYQARTEKDGAEKGGRLDAAQLRTVAVGRKGDVWVGTRDAGLARRDPGGRWQRFRHDPRDPSSLPDDRVYAVFEDRAGALWIGTGAGAARLDVATGRFEALGGADPIRDIREDRGGQLLVATFGAGLRVRRPDGTVIALRHDPADPRSLGDDFVHAVREDSAGRLWVGTRGGLQLREADGSFARYRHHQASPHSLGDDDVLSILEDRGGVLWFGTRAAGAARFSPRTWDFGCVPSDPSDPTGLASDYVTSLSKDGRGDVWIGTMGGGLHVRDGATGTIRRFRRGDQGLSDDRVMALAHDRRGTLWVGTMEGGLNRLDAAGGRFEVYRREAARPTGTAGGAGGLAVDGVMSLFEDHRGTLWIGTFGGGLHRLDRLDAGGAAFTVFRHDPADPRTLGGDVVTAIAEDGAGALWVGTEGRGLSRLDPASGRFLRLRHDAADTSTIADDTIYSLEVDARGRLWVGTRSGLSMLDSLDVTSGRAVFRTFTSRDGLAGNVVYGIESDGKGRLWLSGSQGLFAFDPDAHRFTQYTESHGLQGNEFNFGAHSRAADGELLFGGPRGYNAFRPDRLTASTTPPPVVMVGLYKFNRPVSSPAPAFEVKSVDLDSRDTVVTFELAALDYAAPERNRYAYRLEGFDGDWIDLGFERRVTFTNLDAGSYVLRARAANSDGVWNEAGLALPIRVMPPPWRSPLALTLYVFAAALIVLLVVRRQRIRTAEALEAFERKTSERVLRAAELRRLAILQVALDSILTTDEAGRIVECNAMAQATFGYAENALIGKSIAELLVADPAAMGATPAGSSWASWAAAAAAGGAAGRRPHLLEVMGVRADGSRFPAEISVARVAQAVELLTTHVRDISARKQSELALKQSEARFRAILDNAAEGIIVVEQGGAISFCNATAARMFGRSDEAIMGRHIGILEGLEVMLGTDQAAAAGEASEGARVAQELVGRRSDGSRFPLYLAASEVREADRRFFVGVLRDLTTQRRVEEELHSARIAAEVANRAKTDFLAMVSHEMRTPLNAILGMTELAAAQTPPGEQREILGRVIWNAEALLHLINDMLEISKIEAGQLEIEAIPFDPGRLASGVADAVNVRLARRPVELVCAVAPEVPRQVVGDPARVRQVLTNFLGNAVKFTERGEIRMTTELVAQAAGEVTLRFQVADTGIGIRPEAQQRVFEKFFQADSSTNRRFGGSGLGLHISRSLVELMGGSIGFRSEPGRGSTFFFELTLPIGVAEAPPAPPIEPLHVLVVDDNAASRLAMARVLRHRGFEVEVAGGGKAALEVLHASPLFRVAVLDLDMPGLDALDLAVQIRDDPRLRETQLVLAYNSWAGPPSAIETTLFAGTVPKPFANSRLVESVERAAGIVSVVGTGPVAGSVRERRSPAKRHRILIAEDNPDNQVLAVRGLTAAGYRPEIADNGELAAAKVADGGFDLVLMDVEMPVLDGFQATERIRAREAANDLGRTPIVAMTAHAIPGFRQRCLASGMDDYESKPLRRDRLIEVVDRWVDRRPIVLGADASPEVRAVLRAAMDKDGPYRLVLAESGAAAVELFRRWSPSLVMLDPDLPADGSPTPAAIRDLPLSSAVPMVALIGDTGMAAEAAARRARAAGCIQHLEKPLVPERVREILERMLGAPRARAAEPTRSSSLRSDAGATQPRSRAPSVGAGTINAITGAAAPVAGTVPLEDEFTAGDPDIRDLIPDYVKSRRDDVAAMASLLAQGRLDRIAVIGHNMKGTAPLYGLPRMAEMGGRLEAAARRGDTEAVPAILDELRAYLARAPF